MKFMYTKGDKNKILTRIEQVSDITIYIPTAKKCMDYLYDGLIILCNHCVDKDNDYSFLSIPAIDFYNISLYVNKCCIEKDVDITYILSIMNIMRAFTNLKYVNIVFKDDIELIDCYEKTININENVVTNDVYDKFRNLYSIDAIEIFLGDIFDQKIIDMINKNLIFNGIISNSYLERDFLITFEFDEYISYINMFINNNIEKLSMMDEDIMDYLRSFPSILGDNYKPNIKLYTNYREI